MQSSSVRRSSRQSVARENGFLQERHGGGVNPVTRDGIVGMTRHEDHLRLGATLRTCLPQQSAADAGHDDIGQQEVNRARIEAEAR